MKEKNTKNLVTLPFEHAHRTRSGNDHLFSYMYIETGEKYILLLLSR